MLDVAPVPSDAGPQQVAKSAPEDHHVSFHDVLSALNPLQYLPVIGTIYRAVTGDQIPEAVRRIGSLVVSGLLGGPIGVAVNLAVMVAEKLTGVDLDQTGQNCWPAARRLPARRTTPRRHRRPCRSSTLTRPPHQLSPSQASSPSQPWSPAQLAAYGVTTTGDSMLKLANLTGADVLNALELLRIQGASAAYGRTANLAG